MEHEAEQSPTPIPIPIPDGSCPSRSNMVNRVKNLLFRRMLVGIKDGRFFLGGFYCIDKQGNIILQDTVEYRSTRRSSPSPMEQRIMVLNCGCSHGQNAVVQQQYCGCNCGSGPQFKTILGL